MVTNVARKPSRAAAASGCASVTAVVSSMTPCAAASLPDSPPRQQVRQAQAVERVPAAEQDRAGDPADQPAAGRHRAGQGELRRSGKSKKAQYAGLGNVHPRANGGGAEGHTGDADREPECDAVAHRAGPRPLGGGRSSVSVTLARLGRPAPPRS